jgi:tripartite-type tricarboxylate transporter receptor subunit TctC
MGIQPLASTPEAFGAFLTTEVARWGKVVREAGAQME